VHFRSHLSTTNVVCDVSLAAAIAPSVLLTEAREVNINCEKIIWQPGEYLYCVDMDLDDVNGEDLVLGTSGKIRVGVHLAESAAVKYVPKKGLFQVVRGMLHSVTFGYVVHLYV
jgi:hypothetical protein